MAEQIQWKVPPIRFRGFSEEWDEKPIGEVLTEKKRPIELEDNKLYELVTVRRRNGGVVSRGYLQGKDILVKNYSQLRAGDFIISKRQVVHGATGIVPQHLDKAIVSNEYMVAVGNETISSEFLTIISTLPDMYRKFFLSSYGVDIEKLFFDAADWKKRNVVIPKLHEQNEICSYFAVIDQMIGLHQQKYEKLVTLRMAMLKMMFPQNGATTPEIRFKGFSQPWEEKNMKDVANRHDNLRVPISATNRVPGNTPYYGANGIQDYVKGYTHDGEFILVAEDGANDLKSYPVQYVNGRVWVNNHAHVLQAREEIADNRFLKYAFSQINIEPFLVGGGRSKLNAETMMKIKVRVPVNIKEQQKIGTYFSQMDELIAQHGTQVAKLKQIKTACLEKMFV